MYRLPKNTFILLIFLFIWICNINSAQACNNSSFSIDSETDNLDGTYTYCLTTTSELGGMDQSYYGFVLQFLSPSNTPTITPGSFPSSFAPSDDILGNLVETLTATTAADINSIANDSDWDVYENLSNVLSYEWGGVIGGAATDDVSFQFCVTITGCAESILFDASPNSGSAQCEITTSTSFFCGSLCDCTNPDCPAGGYPDESGISFVDCETFNPALTNTTFTTCHMVTSDANGFLGIVQSVGGGGDILCQDQTLASRSLELYAVSGGQCTGGPLPADQMGSNSATLNPEWTSLTANTDYIACITVTIPDATCDVNQVCVDYYGMTVPCGDCTNPDCPIGSVATYDDRSFMTCAIADDNDPFTGRSVPFTNCYLAVADATGFLGFANALAPQGILCTNGDIEIEWELQAEGDCGNFIANPVENAHSVMSGFNPEYTGLTPNGRYILCVTYSTLFPMDCEGVSALCVDYYGSDCNVTLTDNTSMDGFSCTGDGSSLATTINWTGTFSGAATVGFAVFCSPPVLPMTESYYNANAFEAILETTDVIANFINASGTYVDPINSGQTCSDQIYLLPLTVSDIVGGTFNLDWSCIAFEDVVQVELGVTPSPTAMADPTTICEGESTDLTATGGGTYQWDNGLGTDPMVTVSPTTTTTYTVTVTDDSGNCTETADVEVMVNNPGVEPTTECWETATLNMATCMWEVSGTQPTPPTTTPVTICSGETAMLTAGGCAGGTINWYDAAVGGTQVGTGTFTTPVLTTSTPYYAECVLSGCSSTRASVLVSINPLPSGTITSTICATDLLSYTAEVTVTNGDEIVSATGTVVANGGGSFTISDIPANMDITITLNNTTTGCTNTATVTAPDCSCPVIGSPTGGSDVSYCMGEAIPVIRVDDPGAGLIVNWFDAGGTFLSNDNPYTPLTSGVYNAQYEETSNGCTSGQVSVTVTENPVPSGTITSTICATDLLSYTAEVTVTNGDEIVSATGTVVANGGGSFTISDIPANMDITITLNNTTTGCTNTAAVTAPDCSCPVIGSPTGGSDVSYCMDEAIPVIRVDDPGAGLIVNWFDAGGTFLSNDNPYTPLTSGVYNAQYEETSSGCTSGQVSVTVTENLLPSGTITSTICATDMLSYTAEATVTNGDEIVSATGTVVDNGGGSFTISDIPANMDITITLNNTTTGCTNTAAVTAPDCSCPVIGSPTGGSDVSYCMGEAIPVIRVDDPGAGLIVNWFDAGGTFLSNDNPYTPLTAGVYNAQYEETSSGCTSGQISVTVTENPLPSGTITSTICATDMLSYTAEATVTNGDEIVSATGTVVDNGGGSFTISDIPANMDITITLNNTTTGCTNTAAVTAPDCSCPVIGSPTGGSDESYCMGEAIPVIRVDDPGAGLIVNWFDAGGTFLSNDNPYTPLTAGVYNAQYEETSSGCTSGQISVTVTENPLPSGTITSTICATDMLSYTAEVTVTNGDEIVSATGTVVDNGGGSFTISDIPANMDITITLNNTTTGCTNTAAVTAPDCSCPVIGSPTGGSDESYCMGEAIPVIRVDDPGAGLIVNWFDAGGTFLSNDNPYTPLTAGVYNAQYEETSSGCTSGQISVTVTENPLPSGTITSTICATDMLSYTAEVTVTNGDEIVSASGTVVDNGGGSFTISDIPANMDITITLNNTATGCTNTAMVTAPDCSCPVIGSPTGGSDESYCMGEAIPVIRVDDPGAGLIVNWFDAGGTFLSNDNPYTPLTAGVYNAQYEETSSGCTSGQISVTVTENPLPSGTITSTICAADQLSYTAEVTVTNGDDIESASGTVVDNGGGSFTISDIPANMDITITLNNTTTGCTNTATVIAPDCACPVIGSPTGGSDVSYCMDEAIPVIRVDDPGAGLIVNWFDAGGTFLSNDNPYTPLTAGVYNAQYEETSSGCTSGQVSVTVTENPPPGGTITSTICAADMLSYTAEVTVTNGDEIVSASGTVVDNGGGSFTISDIPANMDITITLNNTTTGCTNTATVTAPNCSCPVIASPTGGSDESYCMGEAIPVIRVDDPGAGLIVNWFDAGGTFLSNNNPFTPLTAGVYNAQYEETSSGCTSGQISVTVTENPLPSGTITSTICAADMLSYTAEVTVTNGDEIVSGSGTVVDNGGGSFTISDIPANMDITITLNNTTTGCTNTATVTAPNCSCPVIASPTGGSDESYCMGEAIPVIRVDDPGAGLIVNWFDAGGTFLSNDNPYTPLTAGVYNAQYEETSSGCTSGQVSVTVTENPLPSSTITSTICAADILTYTAEVTVTNGNEIVSGTGTVVANGGGSFTISDIPANMDITITLNNTTTGCTNTATVTAPDCSCPVIGSPTGGSDESYCMGEAIPVIRVDDPGAGLIVNWFDAGGTFLSNDNPYTPLTSGVYNAQYEETSSGCTSGQISVTVTENPLPSGTITSAICASDMLSYTAEVTVTNGDDIVSATGTVVVNGGGSFTISDIPVNMDITITLNNTTTGCTNTATVTAPDCACPVIGSPTGGSDVSYCMDEAIPVIRVDDPGAGLIVNWFDAGGTFLSNDNPYTPLTAGVYNAQYEETSSGCTSGQISVTVTENPLPSATITSTICAADMLSYTAEVTVTNGDEIVSASGTVVDNGGGSFTISDIPANMDITITLNNTTTGCTGALSILAPICGTCGTTISLTTPTICNDNDTPDDSTDDTFTFGITVSGSNTGLDWTADDAMSTIGLYDTEVVFGPYLVANGDVDLMITDNLDPLCFDNITVVAPTTCSVDCPEYNLVLDVVSHIDGSAEFDLFVNTDINPVEFIWNVPELLSCTDCLDPTLTTTQENTLVSLTLVDDRGCDVMASTLLMDPFDIYIPDTFTPDGDGTNDMFQIYSTGGRIQQISEMRIYNRWGDQVYEVKDVDPNLNLWWDGFYRGERVPVGVYVYYVKVVLNSGATVERSGDITVLK